MIKSLVMTTDLIRFEQTVLYCTSLPPPPPGSHESHTSSAGARITSNKSAID